MKPHEIKNLARKVMSDKPSQEMDEPDPTPKGHGIESLRIEPIENGYMVHTAMKQKPPKDGKAIPYEEPQKHFFPHHDGIADHVRKVFGGGKE